MWSAIDGGLALVLTLLAWRAVTERQLFDTCVTFIAYGLVLSIAWVRLGAVDVALAEAAVGAGFTGALFLSALADTRGARDEVAGRRRSKVRWARLLVCCAVGVGLCVVLLSLPAAPTTPASHLTRGSLDDSGVSNAVTAVLLNFRGFDTLLEVGVMWLAVIAALSLVPREAPRQSSPPSPLLSAAVGILVPFALLIGVYLWWIGSDAPGGAFQGAAMIAGALVSLTVLRDSSALTRDSPKRRAFLAAGFGCFLLVAIATSLVSSGGLLEYPRSLAYPIIILVEAVCMASIGAGFGVLFAARRDRHGPEGAP